VAFQEIGNSEMENHIFYTYKETMKQFFEDRKLLTKENLFELKYDDYISQPVEMLKKVYSHLNIGDFKNVEQVFTDELKNYKNYQTNLHREDEIKKKKVFEEWGFAYETLGYMHSDK
jgi:omega-hydroxy-beta-dihydromenaquinone-9 sulfotransferase